MHEPEAVDGRGDAGANASHSSRVVRALQEHGLAPQVAQRAREIGEELLRRTVQSGNEHAATLGSESGEQLGDVLGGTRNRTDIMPHLHAMQPGHTYVHIHTHPRNTTFSDPDLVQFVDSDRIRVMVALALDGSWYILSDPNPTAMRDAQAVIGLYREEQREVAPLYRPQIEAGTLGPAEGIQGLRHEALRRLAERLGFRYDRHTG